MKAVGTHRWLLVRSRNRQWIARVRFQKPSGSVRVSRTLKLDYERTDGGGMRVKARGGEAEAAVFTEGAVLARDKNERMPKPVPLESRDTFARFGFVAPAILLLVHVTTLPEANSVPVALPELPIVTASASPAPSPPPIPTTAPPREVLRPAPAAASPRQNGDLWVRWERKARKIFLRGDLAGVEAALDNVNQKSGGRLPPSLRDLEAEVSYARCRQARQTGSWAEAVRACERARAYREHNRARAILEDLGSRAKRAFLEGYVMEGRNLKGAVQRYRNAVAMAPTGNPYGTKAAHRLELLAP